MEEFRNTLEDWPTVARLMRRLTELQRESAALCDLSPRCLRGHPASDTIFLIYEHDMAETPNPGYRAHPAVPAIRRSFGEQGLCLQLRFDRGAARREFPILSVCDFGEEQISLMIVEGPPTPRFRDLENAIWGLVYDEALRYEAEQERPRAGNSLPSDSDPELRRSRR
jgi:hypothetical protein